MTTFGKWLEARRKNAGLTQRELAQRAGCTSAYISSLEREVVEAKSGRPIQPSREIVDAIARGVGVPVSVARKAAGYDASPPEANDVEGLLLSYFRALTQEHKTIALALIQALHRHELGAVPPNLTNNQPPIDESEIGQELEFIGRIGQG